MFIARSSGQLYVATTGYETAEEVRNWLSHESDEELVWFKAFGDMPNHETMDEAHRDSVASGLAGFCTMMDFAVGLENILTELVLAAEAEGQRLATAQFTVTPSP